MTRVVPLLLLLTILASACVQPPNLHPLRVEDAVYHFTDYTWRAPFVTDGAGNILPDHPLLKRADPAFYIESLVPLMGAEPNIGVTSKNNIFVSTFDQMQRSSDYGHNWSVVKDYVSPNTPMTQDYWSTADPMMWVDPDTDRVYQVHMESTFCVYLAWSDKEGAPGTWTERPYACGTPLLDHEKVMTAHYGPKGIKPPATPAYPNVLYLCINKYQGVIAVREDGLGTWCAVSFDGGQSFAYDQAISDTQPNCANINGHPAAFPDGTVVVPLGSSFSPKCARPVTVALTEDNGVTWQTRRVPIDKAKGNVEIDPDITVTPDGTAYLFYRDTDQIGYLIRSKDKFQTWEGPWRVSPKEATITAYTVMTSGDNGKISLAYLATKTPQARNAEPSNASAGSIWHMFVSTVLDADSATPHFYTQQVTPQEDPIQVGCIWFYGGGGGPWGCRNLLDFFDMVSDKQGRGYIAITDGCTPRNGCTTDTDAIAYQSRDRQIAVVVQDRGWSLIGDGLLASVGLQVPRPLPPPGQ
jgi:hypothetical protein